MKKVSILLMLIAFTGICVAQDPACDGTGSCPKATLYDPPMICGGENLNNHYCGFGFCKFYCSISYGYCSADNYNYTDAANSAFDESCLGPIGKITPDHFLEEHEELRAALAEDLLFPRCTGGFTRISLRELLKPINIAAVPKS